VIPRAEMLAELMHFKYGIAISGSHGKTTTTCMIASILNATNMDPTVVIGGRLRIWNGSNARLGQGEILVAEADESDGSFLSLKSVIAVVTNIDYEHMDYYKNMNQLRKAFIEFINKIPFYGAAIICHDDKEIKKLNDILVLIKPSRIDIGTIERPPAYDVKPLSYNELEKIALMFDIDVNITAKNDKKSIQSYTKEEILKLLRRRPLDETDINNLFDDETKQIFYKLLGNEIIQKDGYFKC
jgi:UDP-N-acetylmuramate-alanine ligase